MHGSLQELRFSLRIDPDRLLAYYRGDAETVSAVSDDGRTVRFPARALRPFVSSAGVHGRFVLRYESGGRFHSLERLA